jgi:outer membrane lipoprotein-sorting protein
MRLLAAIGILCAAAYAAPAAQDLQTVMARVDKAAAGFRSMSASVRMLYHTAVINDDTVDGGTMNLKRVRPKEYRILVNLTEPDVRALALEGRKAEIYYPKIKTVQEYDLAGYRCLVDQYMLLGFGNSSKDLQSGYTVRLLGAQTVAGQPTEHLELIPKSKEVSQRLTRVELWVADSSGYPVQQQFFFPGGDYRTVTYTNLKMNPDLPDSAYKLQLPRGVKRETPQKQ